MRRALFALALLAAPTAFAGEGVYFMLDGGYGLWNKEKLIPQLDANVGEFNRKLLLDNQHPDGLMVGLRLGYNVAGHAAFEGSFTIHPIKHPAQGRRRLADAHDAVHTTGVPPPVRASHRRNRTQRKR